MDEEVIVRLEEALKVLVQTPHIRAYLEANDPKALEQAKKALEFAEEYA